MTHISKALNPIKLLTLGFLVAFVSTTQTFAAGGSTMRVTADEEARIRKAVEAIDDEEPVGVLKGDVSALTRFWAADLTVNAPTNQVHRHAAAELLELIKQHTGLQYSSFERHREAMVIRRDCVATMGYEIVVPKGNVPDSGKTISRRYINIYYLEDGGWRLIARQATNVSVK